MVWNQRELDRIARVRAENRAAEKKARTAEPGGQPDQSRGVNVHVRAEPGQQPDRNRSAQRRRYVVVSKKCAHGKAGSVVELEATGAVLALVEAGALRPYVKAAIEAETREASDG